MIRRAFQGPGVRRNDLLLVLAMGSAAILLGCGGGGGGNPGPGPTPGACGSSSGSTNTLVCGYVLDSGRNPVANAVVTFRNSQGQTLAAPVTNAQGYYVYNFGSAAPTLMKVSAPAPTYYDNTATFIQNGTPVTYAYYLTAQADGGECIPAVSVTAHQDNALATVTVYSQASPPPSPAYPCPR